MTRNIPTRRPTDPQEVKVRLLKGVMIREKVECSWCGHRHYETLKTCPNCQRPNPDYYEARALQRGFTVRSEDAYGDKETKG